MLQKIAAFGVSVVMLCSSTSALAWGGDGHSIVAAIAQKRLNAKASAGVKKLLGKNVTMASVSSWADDVRMSRPQTYNWHFVDIPLSADVYEASRDCKDDPKGDCVVNELVRLKHDIRCAPTAAARTEALKFAIHFVGDIHQPLHAVGDLRGGNDQPISGPIHGQTCTGTCDIHSVSKNLHALWDSGLIERTTGKGKWQDYVKRLEGGWLKTDAAKQQIANVDGPVDWANQTHGEAKLIWNAQVVPSDGHLDDGYYTTALPILDQQLALGGLRLASFLNQVFSSKKCDVPEAASSGDGAELVVLNRGLINPYGGSR